MPEERREADELPGAIAIARSIRGWSQRRLAEASGVAQSWISHYERGRKTPTMRSLDRIAAALGVSAWDLFELATVARRFRPGAIAPSQPASPPTRLTAHRDLGHALVALLAAELPGAPATPPVPPDWLHQTSPHAAEDLAAAIAIGRSIRAMSQKDLADASSLSRSSLSDYEGGRGTPTPRTLDLIAAALGVTAPELFDLAAVVRRFRTGTSLQGPEPTSLHSVPDLEREILALLRAEAAQPHAPLRRS